MKYLKLFESFVDINEILCKKYKIRDYTLNIDNSIDVHHGVIISDWSLEKLPIKFNKVYGVFYCDSIGLKTLEGVPVEVNGDFYCDHNELVSFQFAPKIIRGDFICSNNNIKTFEYFPNFVKNSFLCYNNPIYEVWILFEDTTKIELLNDFDIFRDENTDEPVIIMDRLNDFLEMIGKDPVKKVDGYKNI